MIFAPTPNKRVSLFPLYGDGGGVARITWQDILVFARPVLWLLFFVNLLIAGGLLWFAGFMVSNTIKDWSYFLSEESIESKIVVTGFMSLIFVGGLVMARDVVRLAYYLATRKVNARK